MEIHTNSQKYDGIGISFLLPTQNNFWLPMSKLYI